MTSLPASSTPLRPPPNADDGDGEVLPTLTEMVNEALVWSALHGLVVGDRTNARSGAVAGVGLVHAPFALLPKPFPASRWSQACELAPLFNELVDRVSSNPSFLQERLSATKIVDPFTSKLLEIHAKAIESNKREEIRLGLHRSDYMLDSATNRLLQIELNTISSSFAGLGSLVAELHKHLIAGNGSILGLDDARVPPNAAVAGFARAIAAAWTEYGDGAAIVLMIVQPSERNMYDQHWLSFTLKQSHGVTTIRRTLAEVAANGRIDDNSTLSIDGRTVAVVYFRAGYTPNDYPSEEEWNARVMIEFSSAVKCPSITYHLVGTKKIQQELAMPGVLEQFVDDEHDVAMLRRSFAGLWSLDNEDVVDAAMGSPELYVLKPQREGGGNNLYGTDIRDTIARIRSQGDAGRKELAAYILMQRIFPKLDLSYLVRDGECRRRKSVSELGVFSVYLRSKGRVLINAQCGYLMRTKDSLSDEGGVAAGFAVLDSVYLTDE